MAVRPPVAGSVDFSGGAFVLRFAFDPRVLGEVKALPGRRFDGTKKVWRVPGRAASVGHVVQLAAAEGWKLTRAADRAVKRILEADAEDTSAEGTDHPTGNRSSRISDPRRQAGDWLRKYVAAYRDLGHAVDVLDALKGLDRVIGHTPFGIHPSGDIGLVGEPGITPLRASSLSHHLSKGARRTRRVRPRND